MKVRRKLLELAREIADEAEKSQEFSQNLETILGLQTDGTRLSNKTAHPRHRRSPALLDPVGVIRDGDAEVLHARLEKLDLDQLKDIVAQYGMDTGKLVMKWRSKERVVMRILEIAETRARKGDAFRTQTHRKPTSEVPKQTDD